MKNLFKIYHQLTIDEIKAIWKEGIFIPDTNVLLSLYRFPTSTKDVVLQIFKKIEDQLWIPHQVAKEFYENRLETIYDQEDAYDQLCALLDRSYEAFSKEFDKLTIRHPFINSSEIKEGIRKTINTNKKKLDSMKKKHPHWSSSDEILTELETIFEGKVGNPYNESDLQKYYQEAETRFKSKIPPGFMDIDKDYPRKYGDFIIWNQIIDKAKQENKPVVFITDDQKIDWWMNINGKNIGPRQELSTEFYELTNNRIQIYETLRFIDQANAKFDINISEHVIGELQNMKEWNEKLKELLESWTTFSSDIQNVQVTQSGVVSSSSYIPDVNTNPPLPNIVDLAKQPPQQSKIIRKKTVKKTKKV